ncbi:ABC transporter permease [Nocardioides rotundus]|uniref:ABC transporter permease n=1 Tax=Nocardioides rotundus TaxID=1774216 RepID=UPI001CBDD64A|nr:ABC transporter permease [Nocardioides rotundus]UAL28833.1 ABC transporter permease [Nocardioides rotundus]
MSDISAAAAPAPATGEPGGTPSGKTRSLWGDVRYSLVRNPVFWFSLILVIVALLFSAFPQWFAGPDPVSRGACDLDNARVGPSAEHPFGYTVQGCSMWDSLVWGTRKSVVVAIIATTATVILGVTIGTLAGWYGGWVDSVLSRLTDIFFGLPFLLGALVFLAIFQTRNEWSIAAVLSIFGWTSLARVMRGSVISAKQRDFVDAARALGAPDGFIIRKHILANSIAPVMVLATIGLGGFISAEATLTFLGVGYQRPTMSWGLLVSEGQTLVFAGFWHLLVFPSMFIVVTCLAFILLGDVLRDALDPRTR